MKVVLLRVLYYAVIGPRLDRLYEWSSVELAQPGLTDLFRDGTPVYCWPADDRQVWEVPR